MEISDYYITEEQSELATSTPPFWEDYLVSIKKVGSAHDLVESICLVLGTAYYDDMASIMEEAASIVDCVDFILFFSIAGNLLIP